MSLITGHPGNMLLFEFDPAIVHDEKRSLHSARVSIESKLSVLDVPHNGNLLGDFSLPS